ncbi:MAG: hypothetical protein ACYDAG_02340 [Chloroflexota bacterium]
MFIREVPLSAARQQLPRLLTEASRDGLPVRVRRRDGDTAILMADDQVQRLLDNCEWPRPERSVEPDGSVSYWLPELDLYANGLDESEARQKLATEVADYAQDYLGQPALRHAPNRRYHLGWVLRAALASSVDAISQSLFD